MLKKIRNIIYKILTSLYIILANSCSSYPDHLWIKTNDNIWLWISSSDTTKSFLWKGDVIDCVPNGIGNLSVIDTDSHKTDYKKNLFYGAQSIEDIVIMDDGSQYIGNIIDNKMEG